MEREQLQKLVYEYVTQYIFRGQLPANFNSDSPMLSTRLLDSVLTLKMINHFEDTLNVEFRAHEITMENIDTINIFTDCLLRKMKG